jgi:hypothetical protein
MSFFPMPNRATIQKRVASKDKSGQPIESYVTHKANQKCLFLITSGNKRMLAVEGFQGVGAFYLPPNAEVSEGDRVINIRNKKGEVVEKGPFEVESVKIVTGLFSGGKHHKSCKIKGITG